MPIVNDENSAHPHVPNQEQDGDLARVFQRSLRISSVAGPLPTAGLNFTGRRFDVFAELQRQQQNGQAATTPRGFI